MSTNIIVSMLHTTQPHQLHNMLNDYLQTYWCKGSHNFGQASTLGSVHSQIK